MVTRSRGDDPGQIIVLNDLTETRELQEQLARHKRLSAMGKTISSLAHQIRTPLTAALLYADKLSSSTASDYNTARCSGKILSRLQNIERQIKDMLIFARGKTELSQMIGIEELAFHLKEAACDIPDGAASRLVWRIEEGSGSIDCNIDALTGAVINLVENAIQASESHQSVEVSLTVRNNLGPCLEIAVTDDGQGISDELLTKLEEPFVTTKSQGTGLGLAIVKLVTEAHHGQFEISPRESQGVTALMRLPISQKEAAYE